MYMLWGGGAYVDSPQIRELSSSCSCCAVHAALPNKSHVASIESLRSRRPFEIVADDPQTLLDMNGRRVVLLGAVAEPGVMDAVEPPSAPPLLARSVLSFAIKTLHRPLVRPKSFATA